ncbi:hypothetical protein EV646_102356 [Kribbella antiqua]|uniref:Uncharacterized protein n=1 Tax=Kribbella antiqua TaxID=2512217 RepID=A0A4R2IZ68_9ACTN|nr:hypothetical protein [Kribbella antiqua]TCO50282.1 hypothetical protein EV646_102356 [Kribbella antiqua]
MANLDPVKLTPDQLAPMLRCWAAGMYGVEAAVEMLIVHAAWLERDDFRRRCVTADDHAWAPDGTICSIASIDWGAAIEFEPDQQSSDHSVLRIACSIADGHKHTVGLGAEIRYLDAAAVVLVVEAIAHVAGWQDKGTSVRITGRFEDVDR